MIVHLLHIQLQNCYYQNTKSKIKDNTQLLSDGGKIYSSLFPKLPLNRCISSSISLVVLVKFPSLVIVTSVLKLFLNINSYILILKRIMKKFE